MVLALSAAPDASTSAGDPTALLEKLIGQWEVTGTHGGEPLKQKVEIARTLGGTFLELHFFDGTPPEEGMPPYEARIFLGWDAKKKRLVCHWLDVFGAAGSIQGEGGVPKAQSFELVFKYPTGWFRNTYTWNEAAGTWRLLIESRGKNGKWSTFADEQLAVVSHEH